MINGLYKVFDASTPPSATPPGAEGVLGYVGRAGETPHVWTVEEWQRFQHLRQFPCWVPDLSNDPAKDAVEAVDAVMALGWAKMPGAETRVIVLDGETAEFPAWYTRWSNAVAEDGFYPVAYGSYAYVGAQFAYNVWAADWDNVPQLAPGKTIGGTQYEAGVTWAGTRIDLSVIDSNLFNRGGVGPRHG